MIAEVPLVHSGAFAICLPQKHIMIQAIETVILWMHVLFYVFLRWLGCSVWATGRFTLINLH